MVVHGSMVDQRQQAARGSPKQVIADDAGLASYRDCIEMERGR
jgi:hypothetical protein